MGLVYILYFLWFIYPVHKFEWGFFIFDKKGLFWSLMNYPGKLLH